jgi:filamentous hemagglutinin family protein
MNALCYKIVFSKRLGTLVAVGEHTVGQGKPASGSGVRNVFNGAVSSFIGALNTVFAAIALTFLTASFTASVSQAAGPAANALPSGASVNSGSVAISSTSSSNAATMTITQSSDKASVNWNSFNIGSAAHVNVQQNSASSVLLNRVAGNDPSQIFGKLSANGQVILINPNGIVFGSGGSVTASAFTASTFGLSEQDFANNKYKFTRSGSAAGVTVKEGATLNATAPGGYIALIGASVDNQGRISTQQGAVVLAAGESVTLPASLTNNISVPLSGKVRLELLPSTINAMVANSGTITTEGGQVLMQAAALSDAVASITHTGTIDTTGAQGGAVTVLADGGVIKATGSITANSSGNDEHGKQRKGGDIIIGRDEETGVLAHATDVSGAKLESKGGFVETSGDYLKTDGISVKAKDWLLDPTDINIVAAGTLTPDIVPSNVGGISGTTTFQETAGINTSEVLTSTIKSAIDNGTNVTISTANSAPGANGSGNINIVDKLDFANNSGQDAKLTLLAKNGITQNVGATIKQTAGSNNNKVDVVMTSEGLHGGNAAPSTSSKGITLQAAITTNGDVTINGTTKNSGAASASNAIGVDIRSTAAITANKISITGKSESSFGIQSASVLTATDKITLDGTSKNWVGVVTNGAVTAGGALNITGTKTTASGYQGINIASNLKGSSIDITGTVMNYDAVQFNTNVQVESATTLNVTGNSSSAKGIYFLGTGKTFKAASYAMKGTTGAGASNYAIYFAGNTSFTSTSTSVNSLIEGTKTAAGGDTIYNAGTLTINSGAGKAALQTSTTTVGGGIFINTGTTVNTNGDVTIGSINSSNAYTKNQGTINAVGKLKLLGNSSTTNGISTTGTITSTGLVSMEGRAVGTNAGVRVGANVTGGSVDIYGSSTGGVGVDVAAIVKSTDTLITAPGVTLTGFGGNTWGGSDNQGVSIKATGTVDSASQVSIVGTNNVAANSSTLMGTLIQGRVKSAGDINLEGYSTSASSPNMGLVIQNTVTSTGGNIKATASAANTEKVALSISDAGALITSGLDKNITMVANTMNFSGAAAINAGITGTVNITTKDKATINAISVGVEDTSGNPPVAGPWLSLNQAELDKITAAKTVVGDSLTTGGIFVDGAVITATATGNITLLTAGNIAVNQALTVGGATGTKNLTLDAGGVITNGTSGKLTATNLTLKAGSTIGATGAAIKTAVSTASLTSSGNQFLVEGNALTVAAKSTSGDINITTTNGTLTVDTVNSITGITTNGSGNVALNGSATGGSIGVVVGKAVNAGGGISITGQSGTTHGVNVRGAALAANGPISITGTSGDINDLGVIIWQGSTIIANNSGTYANGANAISIRGLTSTGNVGTSGRNVVINDAKITNNSNNGNTYIYGQNSAITLDQKSELTNASTAGAIQIVADNNAKITASLGSSTTPTALITQNSDKGVSITSNGAGNVELANVINRGTGDVVVGAGISRLAGDGTGGQVITNADSRVTQNNTTPGTTYIYSGSATGTGTLSNLDGAKFNELYLDSLSPDGAGGFIKQNAESNVAYGATIASGAPAQVLFREKVSVNIQDKINGATLNNTYGDAHTASGQGAALWGDVQGVMKEANKTSGVSNQLMSTMKDANNNDVKFHVSASTVINSMTGTIQSDVYSAANYLKANAANGNSGYTFSIPATNGKYTVDFVAGAAGVVKVDVAQKALTGTIASGSSTYGDSLNSVSATSLTGKLTGDVVTAGTSTVVLNATNTSTSGNLKAGAHTQTLTRLSGADEANYSHTGVTGSYTVKKLALDGNITQGNTTYGNPLAAGTANFSNVKGSGASTDVVTATGVTIDTTGNTSTSGNLKAGTHNGIQSVAGITGKDADNYTIAAVKGGYKVDQRPLTALYVANDKVFDSNNNATVVGSLQNTITGDLVNPTHTGATFDTFAVGTNKTVTVTGISLSGVDLANYKIDPVANPTFTATARAAITPSAPPPPAPVVPTNATSGRVKIPFSAANPFQLASAEEIGGEDFCQNTSIDPLNENSTANSNSSCTCEESKLAQDAQICFEKNTQKISAQ